MFINPGGRSSRFRSPVPAALGFRGGSLVSNGTNAVWGNFPGMLWGLTLSNNGSDATNDIDIATGYAASDTAPFGGMYLASTLTKQLDVNWALGNNAGGLDTGAIANTTYHVFLIQRPDNGQVDALYSTSATAPTMPTGYTLKRRIGSILRESASIVAFSQNGDEFLRSVAIADVAATNPGTSAVTRTLSVPTGIVVCALFKARIQNTGSPTISLFSSLVQSDQAVIGVDGLMDSSYISNFQGAIGLGNIRTNTSAQIRSRLFASDAATILSMATIGWIDTRGRVA